MPSTIKRRPLNSFLGCISLRNGALITGILSMIAAALTMLYVIFTNHKLYTILIELPQTTIKIILIFNLFMTIVISGIMILGVLKERKFFLVVWIILGIMLVISWVISVIYWEIHYLIERQYLESVTWLLIGLVIAILYFYLWLVVYCYYLKLKEEDQRLPYYKPANSR
ncbi:hypothetical protein PGB90_007039 [Kerria lacca]